MAHEHCCVKNVGSYHGNDRVCSLGADSTSMPNLDTLQKGLMNDNEDDVEELMSIITHLVQFAIDDPGVPNPKEVSELPL